MRYKFLVIFLLIFGFFLNVAYTFWVVPLGKNSTYLLETKYSGEKPQSFINADSQEYITLAINLKKGKGLAYPFENPKPTARRMPAFPLFLSWVFSVFGVRIFIALLFQCLLLVGIFGVSYLLARKLFSDAAALVSLGVMLVWPNLKFYGCAYLGSETLAALLFYIFLFCALKGENNRSSWKWLIAGTLFLGGAIYTRAEFLLFIPFFSIWLMRHYHTKWRVVLIIVIFTLMFIPWTIRNFHIFNMVIPTTTQLGIVLEGSYNPKTIRDNPGAWDYPETVSGKMPGINKNAQYEASLNKLRIKNALGYLKQLNISQWSRLICWKMFRLWFPAQRLIRMDPDGTRLKEDLIRLQDISSNPIYLPNILVSIMCLPIYFLFWISLFQNFKNFYKNELLFYFFFYTNLMAILFMGSQRYRFVFEPIIVILGCSFLMGYIKYPKNMYRKNGKN